MKYICNPIKARKCAHKFTCVYSYKVRSAMLFDPYHMLLKHGTVLRYRVVKTSNFKVSL